MLGNRKCDLACLLLLVVILSACTIGSGSKPTDSGSNSSGDLQTIMPTREPTLTAWPTETPNLVRTQVAITIEAMHAQNTAIALTSATPTPLFGIYVQIRYSPDERYAAVMYPSYIHESGLLSIDVFTADGELLWSIQDEDRISQGDPHPQLSIYQWSNDSETLYFYNSFSFDGAYTLWNGFDLRMIDIDSGEVVSLLPPDVLQSFAISPDGKRLAYILADDDPLAVVIRELSSGAERRFPIEFEAEGPVQAGWITWSPYGNGLIFHKLQNGAQAQAVYLDIGSGQQVIFMEYFIEYYYFQEWISSGVVRYLSIVDESTYDINIWTGAGAPTPEP